MTFARGQPRPANAGRKKGSRNKHTIAAASAFASTSQYPDALAYLAKVMTSANDPLVTPDMRLRAATVLAQDQAPRPFPLRQVTGAPFDFALPKTAQEARDLIAELTSKMAREEIDREYAGDVIAGLKAFLDARAADLEAEVERHRAEEAGEGT